MSVERLNIEYCGERLSRCEELHRQSIYTSLEHERLIRKHGDIMTIFNGDGLQNWAQVLYFLFMRTLGDEVNKEAFMEVVRRVPMRDIMRERNSPIRVEAMLMAAAGFIGHYYNDDYILPIKQEAKFMLHKYAIRPMSINHWDLGRVRPVNHPIIRLSQAANLICKHEYLFNDVILCRSKEDVNTLFNVPSTKHLRDTHQRLMREGQQTITIGAAKRMLLGINLVVPLQYAYGCFLHDDDLCAYAQDLNESLPPESNRYINKWREQGVNPTSAYETQALIQLTTCYCKKNRCTECPIGERIRLGVI